MKVLFLDVDGVLNSEMLAHQTGGYPFPAEGLGKGSMEENPKHSEKKLALHPGVALVRGVCESTGAKVVMHSTWRLHVDFRRFASAWDLPIVDITSRQARSKQASIREWLASHPEVEQYAIVDDDNMSMTCGAPPSQQVFTDPMVGLTEANARRLEELLT